MRHRVLQFFQGFLIGILISMTVLMAVTLYLQTSNHAIQLYPVASRLLDDTGYWVFNNLGYSLIPFSITLILYLFTLRRLTANLHHNHPVQQIVQGEHLLDIWISLFFGIGVIWTAIGMRGALIYALGDVHQASGSAIQVLARMVDGGMLTALSTTILGGAGGYLMRLGKSLRLGMKLSNYYSSQEQQQQQRIEILLSEIKHTIRPNQSEQISILEHGKQ